MKTLPTLSDYILNLKKIWDTEGLSGNEFRSRTLKYVNFLLLKLALWMFIPCDKNGKPLEEPIEDNYNLGDIHCGYFREKLKEYQQAQERVIFKGFSFIILNDEFIEILSKDCSIVFTYYVLHDTFYNDLDEELKSIQDLTGEVDLVEWKFKELNL